MVASERGHMATVQALIAARANLNVQDKDGWTALMRASNTAIVRALIGAGANVNLQDKDGWTALMRASNTATAQSLIEAGADLNLQDKDGGTALMWASSHGHTVVVQALTGAGTQTSWTRCVTALFV
jgi:ankyrin repeat protein